MITSILLGIICLCCGLLVLQLDRINDTLHNGIAWYRDYLRQKEQFKRKIYELQTDLETERRESSILKLELDLARQKLNPKSGPRTN